MDTWEKYPWPKWVPKKVRKQIEEFWSHGPLDWLLNGVDPYNRAKPFIAFGDFALATVCGDERGRWRRGRYIHCWNGIGRLVFRDGSYIVISNCALKRAS